MQLTKFTDLGLRVTMLLAAAPSGRQLSTAHVAEQMRVPYTHAAKVVARLAGLGVVESARGRAGGLRLAESASSRSIGWIARRLEGDGEVVECEGANPCPLREGCRLRGALRQAQEAFFHVLDGWTVAEMIRTPTEPILRELVLATGPKKGI
ncbi:transcriptional regulator, BadM/Rrf2 family [Segniliparus rotundus DSM 44985]|uniref:Transcriptional regulator, BadM/Rrf2 family n=1 Tax=Segniliparus rotundus (strain ATCC BAA-972 / CDC 1076 / CIP 108378 / DSM 44985 / JCM 13578) TaxID=640132 RepID=D6ZBY7_SEGRD|nr:Rrf2 family transcriptional regulator [Segniliparus rotundus]ADG96964.1 transcriptional regulator, BadM/Rrf2 family [Segniliparus rotundus DSM 44985]